MGLIKSETKIFLLFQNVLALSFIFTPEVPLLCSFNQNGHTFSDRPKEIKESCHVVVDNNVSKLFFLREAVHFFFFVNKKDIVNGKVTNSLK